MNEVVLMVVKTWVVVVGGGCGDGREQLLGG